MARQRKSSRFAVASLEAFFGHRPKKSFRQASLGSKIFSTKSRKSGHCAYAPFSAFLERRSRKGQWFLIAGLTVISMLMLIALSRTQVQIGQGSEPWQKYLFENIKTESASAINAIIYENATSKNAEDRLRDYLDFLETFGDAHNTNISAYVIVGIPSGSNMNISIVNFDGDALYNFSLTLDGTTKTLGTIPDRNSTTVVFDSIPDYFTVNYTLTKINASGWETPENSSIYTTRKIFSAIKLRAESKDESQIWQRIDWY